MDRQYANISQLVSRQKKGAVYTDWEKCINQALCLAKNKKIASQEGKSIHPKVQSLCLHGDHPQALFIAQKISEAFEKEGIVIQ